MTPPVHTNQILQYTVGVMQVCPRYGPENVPEGGDMRGLVGRVL